MRLFRFGAQLGASTAEEWAGQLGSARDLGYSIVTLADHFGGRLAPLPALAAAVDQVDLRLGTLVLANDFRHPAALAKEASTLDALSGGRFELGIGAGWLADDYSSSGIPMDGAGARIDRLEEAIAVIKGLWGPGRFGYEGRYYTVDLDGRPKPLQRPRPPILIAGGGRRILRLAGREADIVGISIRLDQGRRDQLDKGVVSATRGVVEQKLGWIRDGAGERYHQIELNVLVFEAHVTDSPRDVLDRIGAKTKTDPAVVRESPQVLVGSVEEICDTIEQRRQRFGISYYTFYQPDRVTMAPVVERLTGR
ncbi:MAG TPA: TIGR03621 family F420-dependent LLM class oxidoreductase [Acidimicrobiia bacterium]|nr:TIGR03621 family F420-dependent LLM class oxidoreductase [Acidimicrobiia bacterium]